MEENIQGFLKQTSETQKLLKWCSDEDDYIFLKGQLVGRFVGDLIIDYKDDIKELLQEVYEDERSNYHTKQMLKDISDMYYKKERTN